MGLRHLDVEDVLSILLGVCHPTLLQDLANALPGNAIGIFCRQTTVSFLQDNMTAFLASGTTVTKLAIFFTSMKISR